MTTAADATERRRFRRFPAANLKAQIKSKKGLFGSDWQDIEVSDFSEQGIALLMDDQPSMEKSVTLKLRLEMDMGEIKIEKIDALPKNKVTTNERWRLGLEFLPDKNEVKNEELATQISRIKQILEKNAAVKERLKNQIV